MAHLIGKTDTAMFADEPAWHGLGKVVLGAPTPDEALVLAGLNWEVGQDRLTRNRDRLLCDSHVENFRTDNGQALGVVGIGYKPVQNRELAEMTYVVSAAGEKLEVESAFSMCDCRRVVFTVRADTFLAGKDDEIKMFLCVANGHDGSLALCAYFTSTRVVCNNTFTASRAAAKRSEGYITFRHEGDMEAKIKDAKRAVEAYANTRREYGEQVQALVNRKMTKPEMDDFVTDAIILLEKSIPTKEDAQEDNRAATKREKCVTAYNTIAKNFEEEVSLLKSDRNAWLAFNAATKWMQHQRPTRGKNDNARREAKAFSDMFGAIETAKGDLWKKALALV